MTSRKFAVVPSENQFRFWH